MKKILSILQILLILSILPLSGCVKGTPGTPSTVNPKLIAQGGVNALTSLRDSFVALAVGNPGKYQGDVDALNKILVIASPINAEIQTGAGKTIVQKIEDFARLGATIAASAGLSPDIVIAINLGLSVFVSIEPFFGGASTIPTGAVADTNETPGQKLGHLQAMAAKYRK